MKTSFMQDTAEDVQDEISLKFVYRASFINKVGASVYPFWSIVINLIFGLIGMALMIVMLPVLALIIYLDSPGPIFYMQERVGYKGVPFRMYKFRSMSTDAGRARWVTLTTIADQRVTRIGRFLRTSHLDELPQVVNILRGEMSLVGPRPELPEFTANLERVLPAYRYRLEVKPGLTGWTQVMYHYGNGGLEDEKLKLDLDLYYIENQSLLLDIKTILKTVVEVVFGYGR